METNLLQRYNKKMTYTRVHAIFLNFCAFIARPPQLLGLPDWLSGDMQINLAFY